MKCRPEHLLLFYASLWEHDEPILARTIGQCAAEVEWNYLIEAAETFGVCGGLETLLSSAGIGIPVNGRLRAAAAGEAAATASMLRLFGEVSSLLERSGIPFMPLKGCDRRISGGARRFSNPMEDVDILVREEDVEKAGGLLERNGYIFIGTGSGAHMNFATDEETPRFIEVHWDLVNRRSPVQRSLFRPRITGVWERSVSVGGIRHMSPADLACYLTVHAVKEYFRRPKWLADIAYALNAPDGRADAAALRDAIEEWNVSCALGIAAAAIASATGDARFEAVYGSGAARPGPLGRFMAERLLGYDGLRGMRPLLWTACARSLKDMCAVAAGMFLYLTAKR